MKLNTGDHFQVKVSKKWYDTVIDDYGTQRFIKDDILSEKFEKGEINLNHMSTLVHNKTMKKIDFMELRMKLGMSVCGIADAYPGYNIINPVWEN